MKRDVRRSPARLGLRVIIGCFALLPGFVGAQTSPTPPVVVSPPAVAELTPTPDEALALDIYRRFYYDKRVTSATTDVTVNNGVATLTGSVPTLEARQAAEAIARSVPGVTRIIDQLEVIAPL